MAWATVRERGGCRAWGLRPHLETVAEPFAQGQASVLNALVCTFEGRPLVVRSLTVGLWRTHWSCTGVLHYSELDGWG
jgi:hypothetical protein